MCPDLTGLPNANAKSQPQGINLVRRPLNFGGEMSPPKFRGCGLTGIFGPLEEVTAPAWRSSPLSDLEDPNLPERRKLTN